MEIKENQNLKMIKKWNNKNPKKKMKAKINFPYEMGSRWLVTSIPYLCGMNASSTRVMWTPHPI